MHHAVDTTKFLSKCRTWGNNSCSRLMAASQRNHAERQFLWVFVWLLTSLQNSKKKWIGIDPLWSYGNLQKRQQKTWALLISSAFRNAKFRQYLSPYVEFTWLILEKVVFKCMRQVVEFDVWWVNIWLRFSVKVADNLLLGENFFFYFIDFRCVICTKRFWNANNAKRALFQFRNVH